MLRQQVQPADCLTCGIKADTVAGSVQRQELDLVGRETFVGADQRQVLRLCLRNHHPIERIGMMRWQATCQQGMRGFDLKSLEIVGR